MMAVYLVYLEMYSKDLYERSMQHHVELKAIASMLSIESNDGLSYELRSPDFCKITGFVRCDQPQDFLQTVLKRLHGYEKIEVILEPAAIGYAIINGEIKTNFNCIQYRCVSRKGLEALCVRSLHELFKEENKCQKNTDQTDVSSTQ
jgi:hypothetical protein